MSAFVCVATGMYLLLPHILLRLRLENAKRVPAQASGCPGLRRRWLLVGKCGWPGVAAPFVWTLGGGGNMCMLAIILAVFCRAAGLRRGRPVGGTPQLHPAAVAIRTDDAFTSFLLPPPSCFSDENHSSEMARPSPLNHRHERQVVLWSLAQQYGWTDCRCIMFG